MFYIYKITNLINNKIYIGKTCRDINTRWNEHCSRAFNQEDNLYLHNAINKYGKNNFNIEEIDSTDNINILNQLEQKYIDLYRSNQKEFGYNLTIGGDGNQKYYWNDIRELWDKGYSVKEITKIMGCYRGTIGQALKDYPSYSYHESLQRSNFNKKAINQYDNNRNLLRQYDSIAEAARILQCSEASISQCLNNKTYSALGFFWTYANEELPINIKLKYKNKKRAIKQYDLQHNYIKTFDTAANAARAVHPNSNINASASCILQVCKGNRKTAYGYQWEYEDE